MIESRSVTSFDARGFGVETPARRGRPGVVAALLAGAAMAIAAPVAAVTLDLGGGSQSLATLPYDFVENGTLLVNPAGTYTFGGVFQNGAGTLSVEKFGVGTLILTGANTFSGDTRVTTGTLRTGADNTLSANSLLRDNDFVDLDGFDQTVKGIVGSGVLQNVSGGTAVFTINVLAGTNTMSGTIVDSVSNELTIVKTGPGRENLNAANTYRGGTQVNGGTLGFGTSTSFGTGTITFTGAGTLSPTGNLLTLANNIVLNATGTFNSGGTTTTLAGLISGPGKLTKFGNGTLLLADGNIYGGGTDLLQGQLLVTGSGSIGAGVLTVTGGARLGAATTATLANSVVLNDSLTVDAGVLRLNGVVSNGVGPGVPGTLTVDNGATLILGNANTYTGPTQIVNASILGVANNNAIAGGLGSVIVGAGGGTLRAYAGGLVLPNTFRAGGPFTVDTNGHFLTFNGKVNNSGALVGSLIVTGGGTLTLANASDGYSGGTTVNGNSHLSVSANAQLGNGGAGVALNNGILDITGTGFTSTARVVTLTGYGAVRVVDPANSFTLGLVQGGGNLYKYGPGSLTLNAGNTYTGFTLVDDGTLVVTANDAISAGLLYLQGGSFNAGVSGLDFGNTVNLLGGAVDSGPGTLTLSGLIQNSGILTKTGSGLLILGSANTYTAGTVVAAGEIRAGTNTSFGTGAVELAGGTTLSTSISGLTIANAIQLDGIGQSIDSGAGTLALTGPFSGVGGYSKTGTGLLILSGTNINSGGVTVSAGELRVNSSTGTGNTNIAPTATLSGTGSLAGLTTVDGTVAPGSGGVGTLTFTNLTLNAGSFLNYDLGATADPHDFIIVSNDTVLGGTLNVNPLAGFGSGVYHLISYANAPTGTLGLGALPLGLSGFITVGGGFVDLNVSSAATLFYWDGPNAGTPGVQGGSGIWNLVNNNWTDATGSTNGPWGSTLGIFSGTAGTVDIQAAVDFDTLQFQTSGYILNQSGAGSLNPGAVAEIEVDAGLTATINADILGPNDFEKTGAGTLFLSGSNTNNGLTVSAGQVTAASDGALGTGTVTFAGTTRLAAQGNRSITNAIVLNGPTDFDSNGFTLGILGVVSGDGPLRIYEPTSGSYGATVLHAGNTYGGGTTVEFALLSIDADSALGAAGTGVTLINGGAADGGRLVTTASFTTGRSLALTGRNSLEPASGTTLTWNGLISGGLLNKARPGTLVLGNAGNSFNGLNITSGVVSTASDGALGTGNVTLQSGSTLRTIAPFNTSKAVILDGNGTIDTSNNSVAFNGDFSGAGRLTKIGIGELILQGNNSYTGGTRIDQGTLVVYNDFNLGDAIGTVRLAAGTVLQYNGGTTGTRAFDIAGNSTIRVTFAGNTVLSNGNFTGAGGLTKSGPGTLALGGDNSGFSGGITVADGTLSLRSDTAAGTGTITTTGSTIDYADGVTIGVPINVNSNSTSLQVLTGLATQTGVIGETAGPRPLAKIGAGELVLTGSNTLSGLFSVNAGAIGIGNDNALGLGSVALNGTTLRARGTGFVVGNAVALSGAATVDTNGFADLTMTGALTGNTLTKAGAGRLTLTGSNTYAGGTHLTAGTLRAAAGNNIGGGTLTTEAGTTFAAGIANNQTFTVANNIQLNGATSLDLFGNSSTLNSVTGAVTTNGTTLTLDGVVAGPGSLSIGGGSTIGHVTLNGINTYAGGTTVGFGSTAFLGNGSALGTGVVTMQSASGLRNDTAGAFTVANNFVVQSGFNGVLIGGASDLRLDGVVSDAGKIVKVGVDQLTLNGVNTYTGGTDLNLGSIRVSNDASLGTGLLATRGGTTLVAGLGVDGNSAINLANAVVLGTGTTTIDLTGTTATLFVGTGVYDSPGTDLTLSGDIAGAGGVVTANKGTLTLTGNNSYSGGTTATNISVYVGSDTALGTGAVVLDGSSLQNNSGTAHTLGNAIAFNGTAGFPTVTVGGSSNLALSGVLTGTGDLAKVGGDTVNVTGNASGFTGNTSVEAGRLLVNGNYGAGGASLTVRDGATLGGTGTINANVTVQNAGIFAPGNSPGTITINGNLVFNNTSILNYELGQANVPGGAFNDRTIVNGNLTLDGLLNVTDSNAFGLGVYNLIKYSGSLNDNGLTIGSLPGAVSGILQTLVPGFVNLIVTMPGVLTQYWDGGDFVGNGVIDGGNGTWNFLNTNWTTDAPSALNSNWQGGVAVFAGAAGMVNVAGNESFQGLQFSTDGYIINGAGSLTANGATFIATDPGVTARIDTVIGGSGSINKQNTGVLILNGANSYSGGTTITAGAIRVGNSAALGTGHVTMSVNTTLAAGVSGLVIGNGITLNDAVTIDSGAGVFTLGGVIDGAGGFYKAGSGNLVLNGANTFGLGVDILAGTLTLGTDTAAGTGTIFMEGGSTLSAGASIAIANNIQTNGVNTLDSGGNVFTINGVVYNGGAVVKTGLGELVLNNNANSFASLDITQGRVTLGAGHAAGNGLVTLENLTTLAAGANGLVVANAVQTNGVGTIDSGPGIFSLNGVIGGAGSITKIGSGNLVLNGANGFNGLDLSAGTVTVGTNTAAGIGGIAMAGGTTLAAGVSGLVLTNAISTAGVGTISSGPGVFSLNGVVSGAGSISKTGSGNLVLNAANGFNGLDLVAGTVTLGTNTSAGIGGIAMSGGTTLAAGVSGLVLTNAITTAGVGTIDSGPGVLSLNGVVGGAGSIRKISAGNLILNGANGFNGLDLAAGTVTVGTTTSAGIGGIGLADGTTLAAGVSGLVLTNAITTAGIGTINSGPGVLSLNGVISGPGSIGKIGAGNLNLGGANGFSGLDLTAGTVTVFTNTAAGIGNIGMTGGTTLAAGVSGLALANNILIFAGVGTIDSGPGSFTLNGMIGGPGSLTKTGLGNLALNGNNAYDGLNILTGRVTLGTNTAGGSGLITLNGAAALASGAAGLVVANNIVTLGGLTGIDNGGFVFTLNGTISGPGNIFATGTGNLVLNGNNGFNNLNIGGGTVTVGTNTAAGAGNIVIGDGTTLAAGVSGLVVANTIATPGAGRIDSEAGTFQLDGVISGPGSITKLGSGNLLLNGVNSFAGGLAIDAGTATLGTNAAAGTGTIALAGGTTLAAGVSGLVLANTVTTAGIGTIDSGPGVLSLNGVVGGPGSITKTGSGNLNLNAPNGFNGLQVNGGTVTVFTTTSAGIGGIGLADGTTLAAGVSGLVLTNAITTAGIGTINSGPGVLSLNGVISGPGSIGKIGAGNLNLGGANGFSGLDLTAGTVTVFTNTAAGIGNIGMTGGTTLAAGVSGLALANNILIFAGVGTIDSGPGILTLNGMIGGPGSLTKTGTGNLALNGNNGFAGGLGITSGTVTVGSNTAAGAGLITIAGGTTLAAGTTGLTLANAIATPGAGRIDSGAGTFTLTGAIGGAGGITKVGSGTLLLTGTSGYTGGTALNAGRLTVNGALTASTVTVASGATLTGNGSVGGIVALSGGTVSPGAGVGTLSVTGPVSFAAGSNYLVEISGATSDLLAATGAATLGGANLSVNGGGAPALFNTTYTVLTAAGGRTGTFNFVPTGFSQAFVPTVIYGANNVQLRLAPASIVGLLGSGANGSQNITNFAGGVRRLGGGRVQPAELLPDLPAVGRGARCVAQPADRRDQQRQQPGRRSPIPAMCAKRRSIVWAPASAAYAMRR